MKHVIVLGATGSVGFNTLDVLRSHPGQFAVTGLAVKRPTDAVVALAGEFVSAGIAVAEAGPEFADRLRMTGWRGIFFHGSDAAEKLVCAMHADICVAAMGGSVGLRPAFAAANLGLRILLANKEVLVSAGRLFMDAVRDGGARVLPLDSEHAALWQCMEARERNEIEKVVITASGGPFRTWTADAIDKATVEDALRHPVWRMGDKISVDSATMANKALELFEAHYLFDLPFPLMEIVVHPQSVVHGMVEFLDGSILAHMGVADMRQPIAYMLFYPHREHCGIGRLDLTTVGRLDFEKPDLYRFPLLGMGLEAGEQGGNAPVVYNAANEEAVALFLRRELTFPGIALAVGAALDRFSGPAPQSLDEVLALHEEVVASVRERV
ncbi:MAG: 1-deoxy-D-xylulose-5-phosphate reductoisomerase [Planctomycetaceae bacterium]|nr:1-deoxy-D-xylulose-5-phosphate reductoisomerase [Planctomycetaceae bacterium]